MNQPHKTEDIRVPPEQAVGQAIQGLTAARLGRGFIPLGVLALAGVVQAVRGSGGLAEGLVLGFGALAASVAMLGFGLRISQLAFGLPERAWMRLAMWGSLVPPVYAVYVLAWRGLGEFVTGSGASGFFAAIFFATMGGWAMRSWMRVSEVQRLSKVMAMGLSTESAE